MTARPGKSKPLERQLDRLWQQIESGGSGGVGPQGPPGPKGDKGDVGEVGPPGNTGLQGDMGPPGEQGPAGPQGNTGPEGPAGSAGEPGPQGDVGPKGDKGDQGDIGLTGPEGPQGQPGIQGEQGLQGEQGPQGEPGPGDPWQIIKLAADFVRSANSLAATALSLPVEAGKTYYVEFVGGFTAAATTTGIALALDIPSGQVVGQVYHPISATTSGSMEQIADNATTGATTGVRAANTLVPVGGQWIVAVGAGGGDIVLNARSEVNGSAVTLKANLCALRMREI